MDESFTTSSAAQILAVHQSTVVLWVNQGHLKAWRTAGGHRRIRAEDLKRYIVEHDLPMPAELAPSRPLRLLVVDDQQLELTAIRRSFKRLAPHIELSMTTSGIEALLLLAELKPDAMLIDVNMPDLDGIEVCRRVRARPAFADTRLIVISAMDRERLAAEAKRAGADAYLEKPIDLADVLALLTRPAAGWTSPAL